MADKKDHITQKIPLTNIKVSQSCPTKTLNSQYHLCFYGSFFKLEKIIHVLRFVEFHLNETEYLDLNCNFVNAITMRNILNFNQKILKTHFHLKICPKVVEKVHV